MCFLMIIYMFDEKKKKNSILFNSPKNVQKDLNDPLKLTSHEKSTFVLKDVNILCNNQIIIFNIIS